MQLNFLAKQNQLEEKLLQWQAIAGMKMKVDSELSYSGHKVYAITLSDFSVPRENKTALYVAQPHAHEPATDFSPQQQMKAEALSIETTLERLAR